MPQLPSQLPLTGLAQGAQGPGFRPLQTGGGPRARHLIFINILSIILKKKNNATPALPSRGPSLRGPALPLGRGRPS